MNRPKPIQIVVSSFLVLIGTMTSLILALPIFMLLSLIGIIYLLHAITSST